MLFGKTSKAIGNSAEDMACDYLEKNNFNILERNFQNRFGEIDIIARDKNTIIFVEVKFRNNTKYGQPYESVTPRKQQRIIRLAEFYLQANQKYSNFDCRFDVISINNNNIAWLKNAFDVSD